MPSSNQPLPNHNFTNQFSALLAEIIGKVLIEKTFFQNSDISPTILLGIINQLIVVLSEKPHEIKKQNKNTPLNLWTEFRILYKQILGEKLTKEEKNYDNTIHEIDWAGETFTGIRLGLTGEVVSNLYNSLASSWRLGFDAKYIGQLLGYTATANLGRLFAPQLIKNILKQTNLSEKTKLTLTPWLITLANLIIATTPKMSVSEEQGIHIQYPSVSGNHEYIPSTYSVPFQLEKFDPTNNSLTIITNEQNPLRLQVKINEESDHVIKVDCENSDVGTECAANLNTLFSQHEKYFHMVAEFVKQQAGDKDLSTTLTNFIPPINIPNAITGGLVSVMLNKNPGNSWLPFAAGFTAGLIPGSFAQTTFSPPVNEPFQTFSDSNHSYTSNGITALPDNRKIIVGKVDDTNAFILNYNPNSNNEEWGFIVSNTSSTVNLQTVTTNIDGTVIIVAGTIQNEGNPKPDALVVRINPDNGNILWQHIFSGGANLDEINRVIINDNTAFLVGTTENGRDHKDILLMKLNSADGALQASNFIGGVPNTGISESTGQAITIIDDKLIITGSNDNLNFNTHREVILVRADSSNFNIDKAELVATRGDEFGKSIHYNTETNQLVVVGTTNIYKNQDFPTQLFPLLVTWQQDGGNLNFESVSILTDSLSPSTFKVDILDVTNAQNHTWILGNNDNDIFIYKLNSQGNLTTILTIGNTPNFHLGAGITNDGTIVGTRENDDLRNNILIGNFINANNFCPPFVESTLPSNNFYFDPNSFFPMQVQDILTKITNQNLLMITKEANLQKFNISPLTQNSICPVTTTSSIGTTGNNPSTTEKNPSPKEEEGKDNLLGLIIGLPIALTLFFYAAVIGGLFWYRKTQQKKALPKDGVNNIAGAKLITKGDYTYRIPENFSLEEKGLILQQTGINILNSDKNKLTKENTNDGEIKIAQRIDNRMNTTQFIIVKVKNNQVSEESDLLKELKSKNVTGVVEFLFSFKDSDENKEYIFMEAGAGNLKDVTRSLASASSEQKIKFFLYITQQLLSALNNLHNLPQGQFIQHNDIRLDNVIVFKNGAVKLGDLGGAKKFNSGELSTSETGHIDCASPQKIEARYRKNPPTSYDGKKDDVYALAILLLRLLYNKHPLDADNLLTKEEKKSSWTLDLVKNNLKTYPSTMAKRFPQLSGENNPLLQIIKGLFNYSLTSENDKILPFPETESLTVGLALRNIVAFPEYQGAKEAFKNYFEEEVLKTPASLEKLEVQDTPPRHHILSSIFGSKKINSTKEEETKILEFN